MSIRKRRYRGVEGKRVEYIETSFDDDYKYVSVRFEDKTCFTLSLRSDVFPHVVGLYNLATGDSKVIREFVLPRGFR
jgi:hypothetical protein